MALHHCMIHTRHFKTVWWSHLQGSNIQWTMLEQVDTGIYNVSVNGVWLARMLSWPILNRNWQPTADRMVKNKFATLQGNVPKVNLHWSNQIYLYPELNAYGDNDTRKMWLSSGSMYSWTNNIAGISLACTLDDRNCGLIPGKGKKFIFWKSSRPLLWPTKPHGLSLWDLSSQYVILPTHLGMLYITSIPPHKVMECCFSRHRDNLTLLFWFSFLGAFYIKGFMLYECFVPWIIPEF